jgi:hypothetical protein
MKMNGSEFIRVGRLQKNEQNLIEDKEAWEIIANFSKDDPNVEIIITNDDLKIKVNLHKSLTLTKDKNSRVEQVAKSIADKIFRMNSLDYKLNRITDVKLWMIIEMAKEILKLPKKLQIYFCRNSTRQSIDEHLQIEMLKDGVKNKFTVKKLRSGEKTVTNGTITTKLKNIPSDQSSRSIDVELVFKDNSIKKIAYGFLKYSGPIGSVTSSLQPGETFSFINECIKYCNNNDDNSYFFVQVDGKAGEREINEMNNHIDSYKNRIFVGNTVDVINWLNSHT